jgi:hypothetical protein
MTFRRAGLLFVLANVFVVMAALSCDDTDPSPIGVHPDPEPEDSGSPAKDATVVGDARTPADASVLGDGATDDSGDDNPPPPPPADAGDAGDGGT